MHLRIVPFLCLLCFNVLEMSALRYLRNSRPLNGIRFHANSNVQSTRWLSSVAAGYDHLAIEKRWQDHWDAYNTFVATRRPNHPKKYVLDMFPYPSGAGLHVGHPEGYTATDIMARYWRMCDYDVLHPMGWDAFGLPAEQHAINTGTHPAQTTYTNIATFKRQLKALGFSYDWSRELATTDDEYVKWTQWIFLKLFRAGLAFQSEVSVNWCPKLGTVLANEEIIDGLSERGNHPVVRQPLRQWILKITQYADKLEEDLHLGGDKQINWPEGTLSAQKQWIGRSVGAEIKFTLPSAQGQCIDVFTTRPDTLMGVTYIVLAPEHPLVAQLTTASHKEGVAKYQALITGKSDLERTSVGKDKGKTGVPLGSYAVHPISGEQVPIWIADYVLSGYGTGAVMAVPAHDERDFEFATLFNLPIKQVIAPTGPSAASVPATALPMTEPGVVVNSGKDFDRKLSADCQEAMISQLENLGRGKRQLTYKLRDWVFSRQRYWGEPIPIYFPVRMLTADGLGSPAEGAAHEVLYDQPIPVEEAELPLKLPEMTDFHPGDDPRGCLARAKDWRFFQKDGKWFARETNTMPQWAGSCWYYLRFTDPKNNKEIFSREASSWLPVDLYVGGQEHAVLHLLYARFWHKVLHDMGVVDHPEPFLKLVHQGMILGSDGEKMSKSRGNVVNPDDIVQEHGADALRLYEMFMGPLEAVKPWQSNQLSGVVRFRDRVHSLVTTHRHSLASGPPDGALLREMHKVTKKVTGDIERLSFNTAISTLMVYSNTLLAAAKDSSGPLNRQAVESLVLLLSPFAPHVAEECWALLGHSKSLAHERWPAYQEELCVETECTVVIQVNGKVRGTVKASSVDISEAEIIAQALQQSRVTNAMASKAVKKTIFVPGKILNIIV